MRAQLQNARNDARLLPAAKWMRHNNNNNNNHNGYTGASTAGGSEEGEGGLRRSCNDNAASMNGKSGGYNAKSMRKER